MRGAGSWVCRPPVARGSPPRRPSRARLNHNRTGGASGPVVTELSESGTAPRRTAPVEGLFRLRVLVRVPPRGRGSRSARRDERDSPSGCRSGRMWRRTRRGSSRLANRSSPPLNVCVTKRNPSPRPTPKRWRNDGGVPYAQNWTGGQLGATNRLAGMGGLRPSRFALSDSDDDLSRPRLRRYA